MASFYPPLGSKLPAYKDNQIIVSGLPANVRFVDFKSDITTDIVKFKHAKKIPVANGKATTTFVSQSKHTFPVIITVSDSDTHDPIAAGNYVMQYLIASPIGYLYQTAQSTFGDTVDTGNPATLIPLNTVITDDYGNKIAGAVLTVTANNSALQFFDLGGDPLPSDLSGGFVVTSGADGSIYFMVASSSPGIFTLVLSPIRGTGTQPVTVYFIDPFLESQLPSLTIGSDGTLPLDSTRGDSILVFAPPDLLQALGMGPDLPAVIVLDDQVIGPQFTVSDLVGGVRLPKVFFKAGDHTIFYMVYSEQSAFASQSPRDDLKVTGTSSEHPSEVGQLPAPTTKLSIINGQAYPGFLITVPVYPGMAKDDKVFLQLYLNGWVPNTPQKKEGGYVTDTVTVETPGEIPFGIGWDAVSNFDAAPGGAPLGTFEAQYTVTKKDGSVDYSLVLSLPLDTYGFGSP
jgi:hypothetical protein